MKKLLFILSVLFFTYQGFAQESGKLCNVEYSLDLKKCDDYVSNREKFATFSWDFGNSDFSKVNAKVEIVPVLDCWNGVSGKDFRDSFSLKLDKATGEQKVFLVKMKAKCFKWRLVVNAGTCSETGEWQYFSFL